MRHLLPGKVNGPENTKKTDLLLSVNWQALKEEKIANADVQQQLGGVCVCCPKIWPNELWPRHFWPMLHAER